MPDRALPCPIPTSTYTTRCPLGHRCESCGVERPDLAVATALGVLCLTLCPRCADADIAPPVSVGTAARLVAQHAEHLGIDLDQMAAALADDPDGARRPPAARSASSRASAPRPPCWPSTAASSWRWRADRTAAPRPTPRRDGAAPVADCRRVTGVRDPHAADPPGAAG